MHTELVPTFTPEHHSEHLPTPSFDGLNREAIQVLLDQREARVNSATALSSSLNAHRDALGFFFSSNNTFGEPKMINAPAKWCEKTAIRRIDRAAWKALMAMSDIQDVMTSAAISRWNEQLNGEDVPAFDTDTVMATLSTWLTSASLFFVERVESVFHALSDEHVTNADTHFTSRFIFNEGDSVAALDDLRALIAVILKRAPIRFRRYSSNDMLQTLRNTRRFGEWIAVDGNALDIKTFKKGTLHVRLHPDVAMAMNDVLAMKYPMMLAKSRRAGKAASTRTKKVVLRDTMLPIDTLMTLADFKVDTITCDPAIREHFRLTDVRHVYHCGAYSVGAGEPVDNLLQSLGGQRCDVGSFPVWLFDYDPRQAVAMIITQGHLPDKVSYQFYPSKGTIGEKAAACLLASLDNPEQARFLEPSAGQWDLGQHLPDTAHRSAVEISAVNAAILRAKGVDVVYEEDFLAWSANHPNARFDGILMNPPYRHTQALTHTVTATRHLAEDGVLVCIVPAGQVAAITAALPTHHCVREGTYENAFDDANVTVCVLRIVAK